MGPYESPTKTKGKSNPLETTHQSEIDAELNLMNPNKGLEEMCENVVKIIRMTVRTESLTNNKRATTSLLEETKQYQRE
jgi:hypothetical protein